MSRSLDNSTGWSADRSMAGLPAPRKEEAFLSHIPKGGKVMDFGCGMGRWAETLHSRRPDISLDILDKNMGKLSRHFEDKPWVKEKLDTDFQSFNANGRQYDGIWSRAALYYLEHEKLPAVLAEMKRALRPGGAVEISFVEDCHVARSQRMNGMSSKKFAAMIEKAGFTIEKIVRETGTVAGDSGTLIPTYIVRATKPV